LFTTAITRGELLYGLYCMPEGRRRSDLLSGLIRLFEQQLAGHVLAYDGEAADAHASIAAMRRAQGRATSQSDAMIAGIALVDPWH
jgi:predicted nucleic acid-binding protein